MARAGQPGRHGAAQDDGRGRDPAGRAPVRPERPVLTAAPRLAAPSQRPDPQVRPLAARVARTIVDVLAAELETWPKPGLVSHRDRGSHDDMDAATFRTSAAALRPFFAELVVAGAADAPMHRLRAVGIAAERAMLAATAGVNTHRGAIFGLGLLAAAAGAAWRDAAGLTPARLCGIVQSRWGPAILRGPIPLHSHGAEALRRHGAGGARTEAAAGFPLARTVGLPALRQARAERPGDAEAARVQAFFALLAAVTDTNLLHRGGPAGLRYARHAAADFLAAGGVTQTDWRAAAARIHRAFVARRLSPGGSADLLAVTLLLDALDRPA